MTVAMPRCAVARNFSFHPWIATWLRACFKTTRGPAARDFGWRRPVRRSFSEGGGGSTGASPQRAVTVEPTKPPAKSTAALRVLAEKAVWLRCSSLTALLKGCAFLASPPSLKLRRTGRHTAFSAKTGHLVVLKQALRVQNSHSHPDVIEKEYVVFLNL